MSADPRREAIFRGLIVRAFRVSVPASDPRMIIGGGVREGESAGEAREDGEKQEKEEE